METLFYQIYKQHDPRFWIITVGLVILFLAGIIGHLKNRFMYTSALKSAYLQLWLLGVFPLFSFMWIGMLDMPCSNTFLVLTLYWFGISIVLSWRHTLIFLQEIPKECNNPILRRQWVFMNELKKHFIAHLVGVIYFFAMGTMSLYLLLTK